MKQSFVTSNSRVTIPKEVRQQLGIRPGSRVTFQVVGDQVEIRLVSTPADELTSGFGLVKSKRRAAPSEFDPAQLASRTADFEFSVPVFSN
tara:strand:+ start:1175 stop:1447 length:273 start_codon:yes stop_codon:yes gene_type:complete